MTPREEAQELIETDMLVSPGECKRIVAALLREYDKVVAQRDNALRLARKSLAAQVKTVP